MCSISITCEPHHQKIFPQGCQTIQDKNKRGPVSVGVGIWKQIFPYMTSGNNHMEITFSYMEKVWKNGKLINYGIWKIIFFLYGTQMGQYGIWKNPNRASLNAQFQKLLSFMKFYIQSCCSNHTIQTVEAKMLKIRMKYCLKMLHVFSKYVAQMGRVPEGFSRA